MHLDPVRKIHPLQKSVNELGKHIQKKMQFSERLDRWQPKIISFHMIILILKEKLLPNNLSKAREGFFIS